MTRLWGQNYSPLELAERVGDMRQLAAVELFELQDGIQRGCRCARLRNAAGLDFTVMLDRGMSIYNLSFAGTQLAFQTPVGAVHPAFTESQGLGWLRTWPAGFSTLCGLTQVGNPCEDNGETLGIHGHAASLPASQVCWGAGWQGDDYVLWVEGSLQQSVLFGENLWLRRRIWTTLDSSTFWIEDQVENRAFEPTPFMILQHFNLGFPLLSSLATLELPTHTTQPRDEWAQPGMENYLSLSEPTVGFHEQVFYHDVQPDADGRVKVSLTNPALARGRGLKLSLGYAKKDYPVLVQWKSMRAGTYVLGIEPANCHVGGRSFERAAGTLQYLQPHEKRCLNLEISLAFID